MRPGIAAQRQVIIVTGSNRTGTSLLVELLAQKGFLPPAGARVESEEYDVYESLEFKKISRKWDWLAAKEFVDNLPGGKIVLKYPKSSSVIRKWIELIEDAKIIYVFRPREEAVESQVRNWWRGRPLSFLARWIYRYEWLRGYLAVSSLPVPVHFVTFEELKYSKRIEFPSSWGWRD